MSTLIDSTVNTKSTVLDTSRNVKPDKPKGYLVKDPLYKQPVVYFKDLAKDTYGIVKGAKGTANDHELGKQNDVGLKIGVIAIAAYLTTMRISKLPKMMEWIGAGSFLASMALWPKLAIALPLKLRTGVDIRQKYVDSYGRKKDFYQDSQYLPWDLYSKEEIKKMGDKMRVPYDVPNRDEVIREKARKLSVQGNTLWMATAGFATPTMSALICTGLTPWVETLKQKADLKKTEREMNSVTGFNSKMAAPKDAQRKFDAFLAAHKGKQLDNFDELISLMEWSPIKSDVRRPLAEDLKVFMKNPNDINPGFVAKLYERFLEPLTEANVSLKDLEEYFKNNNLYGIQEGERGFLSRFKTANASSEAGTIEEAVSDILGKVIDSKNSPNAQNAKAMIYDEAIDGIQSVLESHNRRVLDDSTIEKLRSVYETLSNYQAREQVLERWESVRFAKNADSMGTYSSKRLAKTLFSALGFSKKEIEKLSLEGAETGKLLEERLAAIAKDPEKYKKVVRKIAEKAVEYEAEMGGNTRKQYCGWVASMCDAAAKGLRDLGFGKAADYFGGRNISGKLREQITGSLKYVKEAQFDFNVLGTQADFFRVIQTLDLFRRLEDNTFVAFFEQLKNTGDGKPGIETVKTKAKEALISAGSGDYAVKLGLKEKPNTFKVLSRMLFGALPKDYVFDQIIAMADKPETASLRGSLLAIKAKPDATVKEMYDAAIKGGLDPVKLGRFLTGMSDDTVQVLMSASGKSKISLVEKMKSYFDSFIKFAINTCSDNSCRGLNLQGIHNTDYVLNGLPEQLGASKLTDSLIGSKVEDLIRRNAKEFSNTNKWLKIFGIGGAVLLTGTVLATLFFGHIPQKEMYMRNGNKK